MSNASDHNQSLISLQDILDGEKFDRRRAFRIWQFTRNGKTLVELGEVLGVTSNAVSQMLDKDRMPVEHHKALVPHVPERLLPRPEDSLVGAPPKVKRE